MNPTTQRTMSTARGQMLLDDPFFGQLALRMNLVEEPDMEPPTMAVDGRNIFYHPDFVASESLAALKTVVAHEVMHCVFEHSLRRNGRDPVLWNIAGDFVINLVLKDAGFVVPNSGWLCDEKYRGMSTDAVYNTLTDPGPSFNRKKRPGGAMCEIRDNPAPAGKDAEAADWKIAVAIAANEANKAGKLPASLKRLVDEIVQTKTDWRAQLQHFVTERTRDDYCWSRPNKRWLSAGFYLPSLYSEQMSTLVVVTDDSGSISNDILKLFNSETDAARAASRPQRTIVISCDARVNFTNELTADDPFHLENHGGGGTDFRPPFAWLEEQGIRPTCLIYLTDLYGPHGPEPDYPVLWCCINDKVAPWGSTIKIEA